MMNRFIALALSIVCISFAEAARLELPRSDAFAITQQLRFIEDSDATLTYQTLPDSDTHWEKNNDSHFNKGYSRSVWWLDLTIHNPDDHGHTRYLDLSYAVLDYVDVYIYSGDQLKEEYHTGDMRLYHSRPIDSNTFVIPLTWRPGETLRITYRLESGTSIQAPLTLWEPETYASKDAYSNIVQGFFFGSTLILAFYNLLIFFILRDRNYFYYASFIISLPLFFLTLSGQGYRYIWTDQIVLNSHAIPFFLGMSFMFSGFFTRRFLNLRALSIPTDVLVATFALLGGSVAVLSIALPYAIAIKALVPIGLCACFVYLFAGILAGFRKVPSARYYLIAWICFLVGSIFFALSKLGLMPLNFITEHAIQFGSIFQAVLLSLALANSINVERKLRFQAQAETLVTTKRLNEQLENRVHERTQELEVLNKQLKVLSNTDELTGLKNRRYMTTSLSEEWKRSARYQRQLSVLLLDIDFFKKVNDDYGHQIGDQCLIEVAKLIYESLRIPSDQVSRYGGEEFFVMLPETDAAGALSVAERIRSNIEKHTIVVDDTRFPVTVSIGLYSCTPETKHSVDYILNCADIALYQSKEQGRNRVTLYSEDNISGNSVEAR